MKHYIAIQEQDSRLFRLCAEDESDAYRLLEAKTGNIAFDIAEVGNTNPGEVLPLFPEDSEPTNEKG